MQDIFDKELSLEQAGGSESLARELLGMLLAETPTLLAQLRGALTAEDREALWEHAHKIHGSTAYCGVPQLKRTAHALEEAIRNSMTASVIADEIQALEEAFSALQRHATTLLAGPWD